MRYVIDNTILEYEYDRRYTRHKTVQRLSTFTLHPSHRSFLPYTLLALSRSSLSPIALAVRLHRLRAALARRGATRCDERVAVLKYTLGTRRH